MAGKWVSSGSLANVWVIPAAAGLDADTLAWIAAVVANGGSVSAARQIIANNLIVGMKADGIWTKLDRLWLFAAENEESALTDLVGLTLATAVNSPTFTVDEGYEGEDNYAAPTKYINLLFNPVTAGGNFVQNSAHLSSWQVVCNAHSNQSVAVGTNDGTNLPAELQSGDAGGNIRAYINSTPVAAYALVPTGHLLANRSGAAAEQIYYEGALNQSPNTVSGIISNSDFYALATNLNGSPVAGNNDRIGQISIGGSLDATEVSNFRDRLRTYMTAVGVP